MEYYNLYNRTNLSLTELINNISNELTAMNIFNMPIKPTVNDNELDVDYENNLRLDFSHKMAGTRAGLGWIGKTDLFISEEFGPRIRLATVMVNYPLKSIKLPVNESKCGDCDICVKKCPAQAANGKLWNIKVDRDEFFNAVLCRKKCRELSLKALNKYESLCGICVSVCPAGNK